MTSYGSSDRATSASGSNPSSPQNKKGCVDGGPICKKPRIGKMVNGSAPDLSQTASVAGSDCGAIEFSKEAVEALLNEKMKDGSSFEEEYDQMCIKWFQELEGNYMDEQEKLQTMLKAVERRCNESELFMKNEEELNASAQEKVAKEESDKLAVTNRLAREKEARLSAEKLQTSLSEEVAKCQRELQASNQKLSSLNEMYKGLQEYNTILQSQLAAANDNLTRVEKEKAAVVENLSTVRNELVLSRGLQTEAVTSRKKL